MIYPSGKAINHNSHKNFMKLLPLETPPTYTIKDEQEEVIRGKFYEKELFRVVWVWFHSQSSWFPTYLHSSFQTTRSDHFTNFLPEQVNLDGQLEVAISEISYLSLYQNVTRWNLCFTMRHSPKQQRPTILTRTVFLHNWYCGSYGYSHARKKQPQRHLQHNQS